MGTLRSLIIAIFCFIVFSFTDVTAQDYYPNDANTCGTEQQTGAPTNPVDYFGGWYKPARSDVGAPTGSDYFPILVVFVNFQGEDDISGYGWHANGTVDFIDSVISYDRENYSEWWNSYNHYQVSDYWHEFSRGKLHPLGQAISITLPHAESWYAIPSNGERPKVYKDVYDALIALGSQIYWPFYDRWKSLDNGSFSWERDGRVDMMYLIFRHDPIGLIHTAEGFMAQGSAQGEDGNGDYLVYNSGGVTVKINSGYGPRGYIDGSGLVVNGRIGYTSRDLFLEVATHEHGHYLFGDGHITYSKMAFGAGREFSLSPW